eukprot:Pgem_evm1s17122
MSVTDNENVSDEGFTPKVCNECKELSLNKQIEQFVHHFNCFQALLNTKVNANKDELEDNSRLLHKAINIGHTAYAHFKALLQHGVGTESLDDNGHTALYAVAKKGNDQFLRVLLNHGAQITKEILSVAFDNYYIRTYPI